VLGEPLEICSFKPMTGFYRDGCCNTGQEDLGSHTICAVMTAEFLAFSKSRGNDLSTPVPAAVDTAAVAVVAVAATMRVDRIITILKSQPRRGMRSSVVAFNE
jgi:uncharacterized protein (DUF2237 family)